MSYIISSDLGYLKIHIFRTYTAVDGVPSADFATKFSSDKEASLLIDFISKQEFLDNRATSLKEMKNTLSTLIILEYDT